MDPRARVAVIGLGANLGDGADTIRHALRALAALPGCCVEAVSDLYRSAPVDAQGPDYWNAVALVRTTLPPLRLLDALQAIEQAHGRVRPAGVVNAPRTLDLDLLDLDGQTMSHPRLTLPHPRMHLRAFVLAPLADVLPTWTLPDGTSAIDAARNLRTQGQRIERVGPCGAADQPPCAANIR